MGWRNRADITFPIEKYLSRKDIEFICSRCSKIDAEASTLELENGDSVKYDYLIIATDSKLFFEEVEGACPHGGNTIQSVPSTMLKCYMRITKTIRER